MTTNVWLKQEWQDFNFRWNPADYGGVDQLHIPSSEIWLPDVVLYNKYLLLPALSFFKNAISFYFSADGNYQVSIMTKAIVTFDGKVTWEPPALFRRYGNLFFCCFLAVQIDFIKIFKAY